MTIDALCERCSSKHFSIMHISMLASYQLVLKIANWEHVLYGLQSKDKSNKALIICL